MFDHYNFLVRNNCYCGIKKYKSYYEKNMAGQENVSFGGLIARKRYIYIYTLERKNVDAKLSLEINYTCFININTLY